MAPVSPSVPSKGVIRKTVDARLRQQDYDTRLDIIRERAKEIKSKSKGVERLAYDIFGTELISKAALALDTITHFPSIDGRVAQISRRRLIPGIVRSRRFAHREQVNTSVVTVIGSGLYEPLTDQATYRFVADGRGSIELTAQESYYGHISDTTAKTRPEGCTQGELTMFIPKYRSPSASYSREQSQRTTRFIIPTLYNNTYYSEHLSYGFTSPSIRIPYDSLASFESSYTSDALSVLTDNAPLMVAQALPSRRRYNLTYNVAELKDLPHMLRDAFNLYKRVLSGAPIRSLSDLGNLYLGYKFGWESTYKAVMDMLALPDKVARDVNYLISRSGKATTFRSRRRFGRKLDYNPVFAVDILDYFDESPLESSSEVLTSDSVELRCAIRSVFTFPKVEVPQLERLRLYVRRYGADLTISDLYNLIPWTWFADWFTNVDEYLKILEAVNYDDSIIDYGLLSFVSTGKSVCRYTGVTVNNKSTVTEPPYNFTDSSEKLTVTRNAELSWRFHIRKDVQSILDSVKTAASDGLTPYQVAVLTALSAKQSKDRLRLRK